MLSPAARRCLTDDEAKAVMTNLQANLRKEQAEKAQVAADANKKAGDAFLAENKTKEGVVTLPSGLQYKILTQGTGPKPTATDTVVCNYKGTLLDNTEFDSSYSRNQPLTIPVGGVIKGWTEALQLMPVGSKWQLFIPSDLAYGPQAKGPIGANSTLIFEVELLSIQDEKRTSEIIRGKKRGLRSGGLQTAIGRTPHRRWRAEVRHCEFRDRRAERAAETRPERWLRAGIARLLPAAWD